MEWNIAADRPVYIQLVEQLENAIVTGQFSAAKRFPSVRELAQDAGVNPNTMQRALQELETKGLLAAKRTAGRTVTDNADMLNRLRLEKAAAQCAEFLNAMQKLGYTYGEAAEILNRQIHKEDKHQ